jgi:predicted acetyltransferase
MAQLSPPTVEVRRSFVAAMRELQSEGRGEPEDDSMTGREIREYGSTWSLPEVFSAYVESLRAQTLEESPRPEGFVPCTTLWWVDGDEYLGRIAIRHRLTESLRVLGGHIGYDVRPSARRRGHATAMLRAALPVARSLGIESALLTCDLDNVASRKVIEHNGGVLEDQVNGKYRFWVPTSAPPVPGA